MGLSYWLYNGFEANSLNKGQFSRFEEMIGEAPDPPHTQTVEDPNNKTGTITSSHVYMSIIKSVISIINHSDYLFSKRIIHH